MSGSLSYYNDIARSVQVILHRIHYGASHGRPPTEYQWVIVDSRHCMSWPIWYCDSWSINLLSDERLIAVCNGKQIKGINVEIKTVFDLSRSFVATHNGVRCDLFDIYNMLSKRRNQLNIDFNRDWPREAHR